MAKQIDTIVEDIYSLLEQGTDLPDVSHKVSDDLQQLLESRIKPREDRQPHLRMSNIGRKDRQLWYDINRPEQGEPLKGQTLMKFAFGDMTETLVLYLAKMAGHAVEQEQAEVEVDGIKGHIDAIIDGVLIDVKSASTFSFQKFQTGVLFTPGNDPFGYVAQICGYMEATGCERGGFLAVDKTLGKICFCEIPKEIVEAYKVRERIAHIKQVVSDPHIPPRCYTDVPDGKSGNMKLDTGCSYCPHKFACWDNLKTYFYSGGPRYLTKIVREPKVQGEFNEYEVPQ